MDLGTMTALELAEKIKQHQISVLDGVKYVFDQIEKKEGNVHAYLDTYKKKHTPGQNRWKRDCRRHLQRFACGRTNRSEGQYLYKRQAYDLCIKNIGEFCAAIQRGRD